MAGHKHILAPDEDEVVWDWADVWGCGWLPLGGTLCTKCNVFPFTSWYYYYYYYYYYNTYIWNKKISNIYQILVKN